MYFFKHFGRISVCVNTQNLSFVDDLIKYMPVSRFEERFELNFKIRAVVSANS